MAIQRVNYFTGEFLKEEDFKDEQTYHMEMRRRHNKLLHQQGVMDGLQVTVGQGKVTVAPGMAIDQQGREIVLSEGDKRDLTISTAPVVVGIKWREKEDKEVDEAGVKGKKRWTEWAELVTTDDADTIVLARVTNANPVTLDPGFSPQRSGPLAMGNLTIEKDLTVKGIVKQDLAVERNLTVKGNLEVQGTTTEVSTRISRGNVQLGDEDIDTTTVRGRLLTGHSSGKLQISSPVAIAGDLSVTGPLTLPGTPASANHAATKGYVDTKVAKTGDTMTGSLSISATDAALTVPNGNVGIGTLTPAQRLHVNGNIALDGTIVQEAWIAPTLLNGWVNYGGGYNPAGYFRDKEGIVHLRGLVRSGTMGQAIFVLPEGYRPPFRELHAVQANPNAIGRCDITSDGQVLHVTGDAGWFSLDDITFRAGVAFVRPIIFEPVRPIG